MADRAITWGGRRDLPMVEESMTTVMDGSSGRRSADNGLFYAFIALFVWLPLPLGSNRYWAEAVMVIWACALGLWWLLLFARGRVSLTPAFHQARPALWLLAVWLLWIAFQLLPLGEGLLGVISPSALANVQAMTQAGVPVATTISQSPYDTLGFLLKSLAYVLVFALALLLLRRRKRIRLLGTVLVLCGTFQAVFGVVELGLASGRGVVDGTFANRNSLAGYLEMCLAIGIGTLLANMGEGESLSWRQRARNLLSWLLSAKMRLRIYLAVMVIGLVMTHSRMGNSAFFVGLSIVGGLWLLVSGRARQRSTLFILVSLFVIDVYIVGAWFGLDKVVQRLEGTSMAGETRDEVVSNGLNYLKDYPLAGSGGGSFSSVFPVYRDETIGAFYRRAHNDYLQFAVETGVIGAGLLGAVVLSAFWQSLGAMRRRHSRTLRAMAFGAAMGLFELLIHSFVDFNLQIPANAALFSLLLAYGWIAAGYPSRRGRSAVNQSAAG